jgi:hypothetical protein
MRVKSLIIIIPLVLFWHSGICQKQGNASPPAKSDFGVSKENMERARFQINDIKVRGIIVRLRTDKDRIAAYRKAGNNKVADNIEDENKGANLLLMYSFITEWSYCPVYFMESQYTSKLIREDTLVAKTYDLLRDTSIYVKRDSFYIVDYGVLMENSTEENNPFISAGVSTSPIAGKYLVVKGHDLNQLYPPIPFHSKIWMDGFDGLKKMELLNLSPQLNDSMAFYLNKYHSITALNKSEGKGITRQYLDSIYDHIYSNLIGSKKKNDTTFAGANSLDRSAFFVATPKEGHVTSTKTVIGAYDAMGETGSTLQKGTQKLNTFFISYYCIRLDKDKNILCRNDLPYWWQRNPNILYLPYLRQLEVRLKEYMDTSPSHISSSSKSRKKSSRRTSAPKASDSPLEIY